MHYYPKKYIINTYLHNKEFILCSDFIRKYKQNVLLQNKNISQILPSTHVIGKSIIKILTIHAANTEQL